MATSENTGWNGIDEGVIDVSGAQFVASLVAKMIPTPEAIKASRRAAVRRVALVCPPAPLSINAAIQLLAARKAARKLSALRRVVCARCPRAGVDVQGVVAVARPRRITRRAAHRALLRRLHAAAEVFGTELHPLAPPGS